MNMDNRRASILMITLWILTILVIFTVSLGYRTSIDLRLTRYQKDGLRAIYLAKAGINKAISILKEDAADGSNTKDYDYIDACGVNLNGKEPKEIFALQWNNENEGFKIGYPSPTGEFVYGLRDEDSRININGMGNLTNTTLLTKLFEWKKIEDYDTLAKTIITNSLLVDTTKEENILKKQSFDCIEELLVMLEYAYAQKVEKEEAQKKAQEVYDAVKDLITVYGNNNRINMNTASKDVLTVLARALSNDAAIESLITKIDTFRNSKDGPFINQSTINDFKPTQLSIEEQGVFAKMDDYLKVKSDYFRIAAVGYVANISKNITAIYDRGKNKIVSWHQN